MNNEERECFGRKVKFYRMVSNIEASTWWYMVSGIKKGSWAIADVFLIKDRIPYFISGQSVPNVPIDVEEMNKGAIKYARSGISKEELLNQFSVTRKQLVDEIERIPTKYFYIVYQFGTKKVKLNHYFSSLIQHDLKHKEEIMQFLIYNQAYNKNR